MSSSSGKGKNHRFVYDWLELPCENASHGRAIGSAWTLMKLVFHRRCTLSPGQFTRVFVSGESILRGGAGKKVLSGSGACICLGSRSSRPKCDRVCFYGADHNHAQAAPPLHSSHKPRLHPPRLPPPLPEPTLPRCRNKAQGLAITATPGGQPPQHPMLSLNTRSALRAIYAGARKVSIRSVGVQRGSESVGEFGFVGGVAARLTFASRLAVACDSGDPCAPLACRRAGGLGASC